MIDMKQQGNPIANIFAWVSRVSGFDSRMDYTGKWPAPTRK